MSYKDKYNLLYEATSDHLIKKITNSELADKLYEINEA